MDPIEKIQFISMADIEERFLKRGKAVVASGVTEQWPARKWTLSSLQERFRERKIWIRGGSRSRWRRLEQVAFGEYVDALSSDFALEPWGRYAEERAYAAFNRLPEMDNEFGFDAIIDKSIYERSPIMMWLGPRDALTPLHYDASGATMLTQIIGSKKATLFGFDQSKYLYPSRVFDFMSVFSEVNIDRPDHGRHPLFAKAKSAEVVLHPGETLFIPRLMWHQMVSPEISLSVTMRYARPRELLGTKAYWYGWGGLHMLGLASKGNCLCHIVDIPKEDLEVRGKLVELLGRIGGTGGHGRDLSTLMGW